MTMSTQFELENGTVHLETGKIARQASGAVVVRQRNAFILATVTCNHAESQSDFLPLTVDYRVKMAASGRIPGNFFRREARPGEEETLISRLIDRSLRPLFPKQFNKETVLTVMVYGADESCDLPSLGIIAASAALHVSDVPFEGPVMGGRVTRRHGSTRAFVPPKPEEVVDFDLMVSFNRDGLIMLEGGGSEAQEDSLVSTLADTLEAGRAGLDAIDALKSAADVEKKSFSPPATDSTVRTRLENDLAIEFDAVDAATSKRERSLAKARLKEAAQALLSDVDEGRLVRDIDALVKQRTRQRILAGIRPDGREWESIRQIECLTHLIPACHGSALFTRGDTQALVSATLGGPREAQDIETLDGLHKRTFILHYNFPGYSVGEARRPGTPGRREIGHGALARRALAEVMPSKESWPYTTRVVSDITESDGSSSMASVCGGCLALMDAGVPLKAPVAGIAMGMVKEGDRIAILSDILGEEDHLGDMDFKVAGSERGITAIQLDNKLGTIPAPLLEQALNQAKTGRLHILQCMNKNIEDARKSLGQSGHRHASFRINTNRIGQVVGSGGRNLQGIQEKTGTRIEIGRDGIVLIMGQRADDVAEAKKAIESIALDLKKDGVYIGRVTQKREFGIFVRIADHEGLVHVSEIIGGRSPQHFADGQEVLVRVLGSDTRGRLKLSQKAAEGAQKSEALNR